MKMLIADDESIIRKGLLSLDWNSIGIEEVFAAGNGEEARKVLLGENIDIGIFDIRMPGMSGLELAEMIQEQEMDTIVVLLTGFSEFEYARRAIRSGCCEYLLKPVNPRELLDTIEKVKVRLETKRCQRQMREEEEKKEEAFDYVLQVKRLFPKVSGSVRNMLTDMAEGFSQPISLKNMAERDHFAQSYISKKIKQETGYSFIDILNAIRLMNAAKLLQEGESIGLACEKSGFRDQRYFSQIFRKAFGLSPSEYRKTEDSLAHTGLSHMLENTAKRQAEG